MGARLSAILALALALVTLASSQLAAANPMPIGPIDPYRSPIEIDGDNDFTSENGVIGGSGMPLDPYVINSRFEIMLTSQTNVGVYIHETRAAFVVRDIKITGTDVRSASFGVRLDDVLNGAVEGCHIDGAGYGISVLRSRDVVLRENWIVNASYAGMALDSDSDSLVMGNVVNECFYSVIMMDEQDSRIEYNVLTNATHGIVLVDCSGILTNENHIRDTNNPYSDDSWTGNVWPGNEKVIDQRAGRILILWIVLPACVALVGVAYFVRRRRVRTATR